MYLNTTKDITTKIDVAKGDVTDDTIINVDKVQETLSTACTKIQAVTFLVRIFFFSLSFTFLIFISG